MDTHSPTEPKPETEQSLLPVIQEKSSTLHVYLIYGVVGIVIVATTIGILFFVAKDSLPGEPLYKVKTEGSEKVQLFLKRSAASRAGYNNTLLETRLDELQTLDSDDKVVSNEVLAQVASGATSHTNDTLAVLEKSNLSFEEKINLLAPLSDLTRTIEVLVDDTEEFSSIKTIVSDADSVASKALENAITAFVAAGPVERVFAMIQAETQILAEQSAKVAYGSTAQKTIARRAEDIADALRENNFKDALSYILKAQLTIVVDEHLFDAERGPIDGASVEPGVMPEGS